MNLPIALAATFLVYLSLEFMVAGHVKHSIVASAATLVLLYAGCQ